jgi:gas vesicle protein
MNAKAIFSGIVAGTALIGALTLLTTPRSGKEMRHCCKDSVLKIRDELDQFTCNSKKASLQLKQTVKIGTETFKSVGEEVKESVQDWKVDIEPTLNQIKEDIDALQKTVAQTKKIT